MIGKLTGTLIEKNPPQIVLDVSGVGYEVDVPMSTFYHLPETGETVSLFTHLWVREDAMMLFGFSTEAERRFFRILIRVSGIGARTALGLLSGLTVDELIAAVHQQDYRGLIQIPGIGRKTAERLLLELRDKLSSLPLTDTALLSQPVSAHNDILNALITLGYSEREAVPIVKSLDDTMDVSEGIRLALQKLSSGG